MIKALLCAIALIGGMVMILPASVAQSTGPVHLLVGFAPGSNADLVARALADALRLRLGRPVEVENRAERQGADMAEALARSAPDGDTLGILQAALAVIGHVTPTSFDLQADFSPIGLFAAAPMAILVAPDHVARDLRGLAEVVRGRPETPCGSAPGFIFRLTAARIVQALGIECPILPVENREAAAALQAGRIQFYVYLLPATLATARDGRARYIAVTSKQRSATVPEVPTVAEAGLPGFEATGWFALVGPRGVPQAIVAMLEQAVIEAVRDPVTAAKLRALGAEPVDSTSAELADMLRVEDAKWGEAARAAGLARH